MSNELKAPEMSLEDFNKELMLCDSYSRLGAFLELNWIVTGDTMPLLGKHWSSFDNVSEYYNELSDLFSAYDWPINALMDKDERAKLAGMPDEFIVYRGCYQHNKDGVSWTTNREVAERFPTLNRYKQEGQPLLVKARVKKCDVVAMKLDRDEDEVIVFGRLKHVSTSNIRL